MFLSIIYIISYIFSRMKTGLEWEERLLCMED
ncbi:hypothetical protein Krac_6614 [Ktedonobacter racemifer DSM 44963]|uniref:Uncharacterized protein n=1 Tax=Ktedonobacter racemifer DSM 44963 TaxID=485913 RepID=D6TVJ2_KTERA|nr:hypothetical protein Krac_6614 [Ktedonobacter racemifer DSM 44963]